MAVCYILFLLIMYKYLLKDIDEVVEKKSNNNHEQSP